MLTLEINSFLKLSEVVPSGGEAGVEEVVISYP